MNAVVYLVPVGATRHELYTEPPDEGGVPPPADGFFARHLHRLRERWRDAVQTARQGDRPAGRMARARDWMVSRIAESIAEQRTLWLFRHLEEVDLRYPPDLSEADAMAWPRQLLTKARRHHGIWLIVDTLLFAVSGVFVLIPGPNVFAYYFGLRALGHVLSWRGATRGLDAIRWRPRAEPALQELRALASLPRESRAQRVEAIASALKLPRLSAFFERVAV